jgi:hypothetical protein
VLEQLSRAKFEGDIRRLSARTVAHRAWTVVSAEYPILDVIFGHASAEPLRIRMICDQWNDLPASIELLSASGTYLSSFDRPAVCLHARLARVPHASEPSRRALGWLSR